MILVLLLNLVQADGDDNRILWDFLKQITIVFIAEVIADWIKHAFITKFNGHDSRLYERFKLVLVQVRIWRCKMLRDGFNASNPRPLITVLPSFIFDSPTFSHPLHATR